MIIKFQYHKNYYYGYEMEASQPKCVNSDYILYGVNALIITMVIFRII